MVGVNCDGPTLVFEIARKMVEAGHAPVSGKQLVPLKLFNGSYSSSILTRFLFLACPNAGQPRSIDQRMMYMATPEYFGVYGRRMLKAGVRAVGGCCGTTGEHLEVLSSAVRMLAAGVDNLEEVMTVLIHFISFLKPCSDLFCLFCN
tara:strand:- start:2020 stop:2460 length:441 start_codon:yes stop_codon:yes gene_type:complete